MTKEKLIMFSWTNMYMHGIHTGIQAGHCWMDMATKHTVLPNKSLPKNMNPYATKYEMFWDWARDHKTVNIRNGGYQSSLIDIVKIFQRADNPYPWGQWREEQDALNGAMTAVSIVVPEHVFAWEPEYEIDMDETEFEVPLRPVKKLTNPLDPFDHELYTLIKSTRHAT